MKIAIYDKFDNLLEEIFLGNGKKSLAAITHGYSRTWTRPGCRVMNTCAVITNSPIFKSGKTKIEISGVRSKICEKNFVIKEDFYVKKFKHKYEQ